MSKALMSAKFLDSKILKNSFDLMKDYAIDTLHMGFVKDGIDIRTLDASKTCGYYCTIGLDHMSALSGEGVVFFNDTEYEKGLKNKLVGKSEILIDDGYVTFKIGKSKHVLRRAEDVALLEHIPNFDYSLVEIKTDDFVEGLDSLKSYEENFVFSLTKNKFEMKCGSDKFSYGKFSITGKDLLTLQMFGGIKKAESIFNPELVSDHLKIFKMSKSVEIGIGNDTPILFRPKIYGAKVTIFIAPKIDNDENEQRKKDAGIG